ncbi:MAG: alanine racemase [Candidatus Kerfeldbacteria bacterium]|nr:alanine racemase [Candidatus Kerfeldbacteria bacterium]
MRRSRIGTAHPLTWVAVHRGALRANIHALRSRLVPGTEFAAVVKGDAYGHGMIPVAQAIARTVNLFAVAHTREALLLRDAGMMKPILVLSYADPELLVAAVRARVEHVVHDAHSLAQLERAAQRAGQRADVHVKIDTGTTRIGVQSDELAGFVRLLARTRHCRVTGVFTHYANAEEETHFMQEQTRRFADALAILRPVTGAHVRRHSACTAAVLTGGTTVGFDMVRVGIGLYGLWPSQDIARRVRRHRPVVQLTPALSWSTHVIQVKTVPSGTSISYGRTYRTTRTTRLAVLPVGYYDGYDRGLSNRGAVLVNGCRAPIRGRVCMNLTMVDVTRIPGVRPGNVVTLIGKDGADTISATDLAAWSGTINYEIVSRISPSIPRIYQD